MNDTSPWIDPELITAGKLLQEKGLAVPDRTVAPLSEGARRRTGSARFSAKVRCRSRRNATCCCPARMARCRAASKA